MNLDLKWLPHNPQQNGLSFWCTDMWFCKLLVFLKDLPQILHNTFWIFLLCLRKTLSKDLRSRWTDDGSCSGTGISEWQSLRDCTADEFDSPVWLSHRCGSLSFSITSGRSERDWGVSFPETLSERGKVLKEAWLKGSWDITVVNSNFTCISESSEPVWPCRAFLWVSGWQEALNEFLLLKQRGACKDFAAKPLKHKPLK